MAQSKQNSNFQFVSFVERLIILVFLSGFQSDTVQDETAKNSNNVPYDCVPLNVLVVVTFFLPSDESIRE